tara:strand:+ start:22 stop:348 length:327 start_codon:yes stop_codon:yes gene_type:complete
MSIRVELNQGLLIRLRSKLDGRKSDTLSLVELALEEQGSFENIHNAVKNGTNYSKTADIGSVNVANTSIVDMDDTLYLLTDKLMEVIELVSFKDLTRNTYKIRDSNWE